jgi:UDP-N-acetylmuramyl tripeptide synthase
MKVITLIICKIVQFILKLMGRGTSLPGKIALKLYPDILKNIEKPQNTICVTGTTGKTSICGILTEIYKKANLRVGNNIKGSNLKPGVVSLFIDNTTIFGKTKADVLVIEVDERYVKEIFKDFKPNYFIINNLSRDQLARNGHFDLVWNEINNSISKDIHLILNADDPLITKFAINHKGKVSYYGLSKNKLSKKKNNGYLDVAYCPKCHNKLIFDYFHYGNLGQYHCPNHDFNRPKVELESKLITNLSFKIDNQIINMNNNALYNVYNLSAGYVTAIETGIDKKIISETLNNLSLKVKRLDTFNIGNKKGVLLLSKNETPISYNQSLEYINNQKEDKTVIIGFDRVSGRYDLKDLSWLYDINFELLNNDTIKKIVCIGPFANDIALRLKYADIDLKKVSVNLESDELINIIKNKTKGTIYCVLYFDIFYKFKKLLHSGVK